MWLSDSRGHPLRTLAELERLLLFSQSKGKFEDVYGTLLFVYMFDCIIAIYTDLNDSSIYSDIHNFVFWLANQVRSAFTTYSVVIYLITVSDIMW